MERMTLHRALSELKVIDAKIVKQTHEVVPSGVYQKGKLINNIITEDEFKKQAQGKLDSVLALIERKCQIKSAIVEANSKTQVVVGGKTMSIADAINYKTVIKFKKDLILMLKQKHNLALGALNKGNETVNTNVQKLLEAALGKDNVKTDSSEVEAIRKPYMDANEVKLFDPLNIAERIEKMESEVADFEADCDASLSEVNAITFIGEAQAAINNTTEPVPDFPF